MLTMAELESTLQIEYELQLEAMDEQALRALLADPGALNALMPAHMSFTAGQRIAEATLEQLLARQASSAEPVVEQKAEPLFAQWFKPFWTSLFFDANRRK